MKRIIPLLSLLLLLLFCPADAPAERRMLFVGCDRFVSLPSTFPAGVNNATKMYELFGTEADKVTVLVDQVPDAEALESEILAAFSGADDDDENWLYLSTHGVLPMDTEACLVLSDGVNEDTVTAEQLKEMLDRVPGVKVIILDACHSGALIGKGMNGPADNVFTGNEYKIITSCGGAELSWLWSSADDRYEGAGWFTAQLVRGMSAAGDRAADEDRNGSITFSELKRYLTREHGASAIRTYPEEDDLVLLTYDTEEDRGEARLIGSVSFSSGTRDEDRLTLRSSFVIYHRLALIWRLIPFRDGIWDFDSAVTYKTSETGAAANPGRGTRLITANGALCDGYTLLTLMSTDTRGKPVPITSRSIAHIPDDTDPRLRVSAGEAFRPDRGEELRITVRHACPCLLTVSVVDENDRAVKYLCISETTRPCGLEPAGTELWWNGEKKDGTPAAPGKYRIRVRASVGNGSFEAYSDVIEIPDNSQENR